MASSPENKMVSFVGNPTLKFFTTVWWLSIGAACSRKVEKALSSERRFHLMRFESRFSVVSLLFAAKKRHSSYHLFIKKRRYYYIKRSTTGERIVVVVIITIVVFSVCARKSFHRTKNEREREKRRLDKIFFLRDS
jgi:hypothetical protein